MKDQYGDVTVTQLDGHVAQCEIRRPPNNFFDHQLIMDLADCFEDIDKEDSIRTIVLCSEGKHFCAGANFGSNERAAELEKRTEDDRNPLYDEAVRLFRCKKPVIAAVQGAAIELAQEIAENAPLALLSLREQMRPDLADAVNAVTTIESREQKWLQATNDHKEGVKAVAEKRPGNFTNS